MDAAAETDRVDRTRSSELLGLFLGFGALVLLVYRGCLAGPFLSDDIYYYVLSPAATPRGLGDVLAWLDPRHPAHLFGANYAPLHLLGVAVERRLFGAQLFGYHAVNLALHALNAALLVALLRSSRIPRRAAILGGAVFAVHPANVETVAWVSQLKSVASLTLGLGAMLCLERRRAASLALFSGSLLVKFASAAFLPMAVALAWARGAPQRTWGWLAGWLVALAVVTAGQLHVFSQGGSHELAVYTSAFEQLRSIVAIGARYLWMATTGLGISTFHDPEPARSLLDPWWLAGLVLGVAIAWRALATLLQRSEEGAWWMLALGAFLPVSQLVPFRFPIADRYLYFMLPGLIGATWLVALALTRSRGRVRGERGGASASPPGWPGRLAAAAAVLWVVGLGSQAIARVPVWLGDLQMMRDSAKNYPQGTHGLYLEAVEAAQRGDVEEAVALLRTLEQRTRFSLTKDYARDPRLAYIRDEPAFRAFVHEVARYRIDLAEERGRRPGEGALLALKYADLGQYDRAIELLEETIRAGDHRREQLIPLLEDIRILRRRQEEGRRPDPAG